MKILVTGGAGFIGSHLVKRLLSEGHEVAVVDNFNPYYSPELKEARVKILFAGKTVPVYREDIADFLGLEKVFKKHKFDKICHLAAQAGVRYSLSHPEVYEITNVEGTLNLLRLAAKYEVPHFVFASSSSVYGQNTEFPSGENFPTSTPISLYAATKIAGEAMLHSYSHTHKINSTVLRFFNVYGPWVRPDMALYIFTKKIFAGEPLDIFNNGESEKDFTYIDDIVDGITRALNRPFAYEVFNLGNAKPVLLKEYVALLEKHLGKAAEKNYLPLQLGDVPKSFAAIAKARKLLGYEPKVKVEEGISRFVEWYRQYEQSLGLAKF